MKQKETTNKQTMCMQKVYAFFVKCLGMNIRFLLKLCFIDRTLVTRSIHISMKSVHEKTEKK